MEFVATPPYPARATRLKRRERPGLCVHAAALGSVLINRYCANLGRSSILQEARMGILAWILLGLIAGAVAQLIVPGPGGILLTLVIGIVGAFIGGFIGSALGWGTVSEFDVRSIALAILGAVVFLLLLRALRGGGTRLA